MAKFNTEGFKPKGERRDGDDEPRLDKAGRYVIAAKWTSDHVELTSNDKPFIRCFFHVIHGPMKGRWFKEDVFCHEAALDRLTAIMVAVGFKGSFDPEEDPFMFAKAILHRPFSGKIGTENGNDGERYARLKYSDPLRGDEIEVAKKYMDAMKEKRVETLEKLKEQIERRREQRAADDDYGDFGGSGRGGRGGGGGGRGRGGRRDDFDDDFSDDIPF